MASFVGSGSLKPLFHCVDNFLKAFHWEPDEAEEDGGALRVCFEDELGDDAKVGSTAYFTGESV